MHLKQPSCVFSLVLLILGMSCNRLEQSKPHALAKSAVLEVYSVSSTKTANSRAVVDPQSKSQIYLALPPTITPADIDSVKRGAEDPQQQPTLSVKLTPQGAKKLSAATTPAVGQQLAIVVNGRVLSVAKVRSPLSDNFNIASDSIGKDWEEIFAALTKE